MSNDEVEDLDRIRERLEIVTAQLEREMIERGFDPQQAENVPLTASMANLHFEQRNLRSRLTELLQEQEES